ncbi:arylesterase [Planctobacterium marinum]|uniref:Multifunctional acyl-CoA thioesterase I/protease I/lysophospholipase L1 n=1 Tax=Planctobacterium marinum TaxID=1631968 RepID=A0AA48HM98_9ALTE|nr:multifunctional acyl-CoA thioesterase I/protease I/lysophospholipase L1 [Planctobacterium marinum]
MLFRLKILLLLIPLWVFSDHLQARELKLLVLGDSLSAAYNLKQEQGWVALLQKSWQDKGIEIVNAAISGETSDGGLQRFDRLLEQHSPTHLYLELGANDGLRGYPVNKMKQNLAEIIKRAQQQDIVVILQEMRIPTNYGPRYTRMFTQAYGQLSKQYDVSMISFFLEEIALKPELMQRDGLHPNADAQPILAAWMAERLAPLVFTAN